MFFNLPYGAKVDKYLAGMPTTSWLTWTNPRNEYSNAIILAAGGGGGGGSGTITSTPGGAGGGGAGGFGHIYCPLSLLPDTLYIQVGTGGAGAATSSDLVGSDGANTYVNLYPSIQTANNLITCSAGLGGKGGSAAGAGGVGGNVTINNTLGIAQGYTGGTGATYSVGASLPITGSPIYGGGAGGGGATGSVGSGMTSVSSLYPSVAGGTASGSRGPIGFVIQKPFTVFGGGGGFTTGTAGSAGGHGIMGSGGGGGGGANAAFSGGGGNGGSGFVIIICY
jgi:hypothetical protein